MEHVVQFDATRRTLPGLERLVNGGGNTSTPQGGPVEVLHGSSARVVRCWVKSRNERNPCPVLPFRKEELAGDRQR